MSEEYVCRMELMQAETRSFHTCVFVSSTVHSGLLNSMVLKIILIKAALILVVLTFYHRYSATF